MSELIMDNKLINTTPFNCEVPGSNLDRYQIEKHLDTVCVFSVVVFDFHFAFARKKLRQRAAVGSRRAGFASFPRT